MKITITRKEPETIFEVGRLYRSKVDKTIIYCSDAPHSSNSTFPGVEIRGQERGHLKWWIKDCFTLLPPGEVVTLQNPPEKPAEFKIDEYYEVIKTKEVGKCIGCGVLQVRIKFIKSENEEIFYKEQLRPFHGSITINTEASDETDIY